MNLLSSFSDFYGRLSSDGLFFFWIVVFLFCFLLFLTVILVLKNRKLVKLLKEEHDREVSSISEENNIKDNEEVIIKIEENKEETGIKDESFEEVKEGKVEIQEEVKNEDVFSEVSQNGPYKKNVLSDVNSRRQTSPISIRTDDVIYNDVHSNSYDNYDLDEIYLRDDSVSPLEAMENNYEVNDNMKFASEIVERMEEEMKPSNIELTDYEKKQEEEAIISYDELLKVKDKIYNITDDEETDEFIDQLKSFRLDL